MNCNRVQFLLPGYVDGELDLVNSIEIEEHLHSCTECSQNYKELLALRSQIQQAGLIAPTPAGLEKRIRASIRKENPAPRIWGTPQWGWALAAILLVALIVLGTGIRDNWFTPNPGNMLVAEVEAAHVRSLMADHLTDVTSTDQHTVKPWFDGKLDFSPPVIDLSAQGFPLIGGRLDYLNNQQVAALIYRRNKHLINLFIWPSGEKNAALQTTIDNGYYEFHWIQNGMNYWAISDLNAAELHTFIQLFQQGTQGSTE